MLDTVEQTPEAGGSLPFRRGYWWHHAQGFAFALCLALQGRSPRRSQAAAEPYFDRRKDFSDNIWFYLADSVICLAFLMERGSTCTLGGCGLPFFSLSCLR